MNALRLRQCGLAVLAVALTIATVVASGLGQTANSKAGNLDPAALAYKLPDQIEWKVDAMGAESAILQGDPSKPGLYVVLVK